MRTFLQTVLIVCVIIVHETTHVHANPRHILFIVADDFGWNDVGFRNENISTPNIDKLAKEGVILNQSYVQPVCSPSRNAFMTGVYPFKAGLQHLVIWPDQKVCAPTNLKFLPQHLKGLGYKTHMIGKWHLGFCKWECTPTYRGFDTFNGFLGGQQDYYTKVNTRGNKVGYDFRNNTATDKDGIGTYSTYEFAARAAELIGIHNKSEPFFLYMPLQSVHIPIQVPIEYENMYKHIHNEGRRKFSGMVTAMDDVIGVVTDALKVYGMYEDTLIIFTADNGGWPAANGNNWPLRGSKITIYEGGTRVTAFVHGAGLEKTGYTYNGMIHAVDWSPTIVAAAGGVPDDPNERNNLSDKLPDVVKKLRMRMAEYHKQMVPANYPNGTAVSDPKNYNGFWSPGWC
ncbi:arylsulfatase J-like [Argopecten irradians]|uniref:arylsulfatase J-like n=1 Tax=Argopecten irradians TaxID=31199 RepID=UPI003722FC72